MHGRVLKHTEKVFYYFLITILKQIKILNIHSHTSEKRKRKTILYKNENESKFVMIN